MPISDILAGLFGGLNQGSQQIIQQRKQQEQLKLQQLASEREKKLQEFNMLKSLYDTTPNDVDIDPQQAQKFSSLGLPVVKTNDGRIRRPSDVREKIEELKMKTELINQQVMNNSLSESQASKAFRDQLATDEGAQRFLNQPLAKRQMAMSIYGLKGDVPMTLDEVKQQALAAASGQMANTGMTIRAQMGMNDTDNATQLKIAGINAGARENALNQGLATEFDTWFHKRFSQSEPVKQAYKAAQEDGQLDSYMQHMFQVFKQERQQSQY